MGLFDDAVPGGNIAKPLLIALGALLAGRMLSGGGQQAEDEAPPRRQVPPPPPQRQVPSPRNNVPQDQWTLPEGGNSGNDGGILGGGLGGLLEKLQKQGQGEVVDSWVGRGENKPVPSEDLGRAIGGGLLAELSRRTGIPEGQLLEQLSKALPGVVDKLTPNGQVPSNEQVAGRFRNSPW